MRQDVKGREAEWRGGSCCRREKEAGERRRPQREEGRREKDERSGTEWKRNAHAARSSSELRSLAGGGLDLFRYGSGRHLDLCGTGTPACARMESLKDAGTDRSVLCHIILARPVQTYSETGLMWKSLACRHRTDLHQAIFLFPGPLGNVIAAGVG